MKKGKLSLSIATVLLIITSLLITSNPISANAAEATYDDGTYSYYGSSTLIPSIIVPFYETNTHHPGYPGVSTTINVYTTYTNSLSASQSLTAGGSAFGFSISSTLGATQTESFSLGVGVAYTIDKTAASGYYRVITVYPSQQLQFYKWRNSDGRLVYNNTITYAPTKYAAYKDLEKNSLSSLLL